MTTAMIPGTVISKHVPLPEPGALLNLLIVDDDRRSRELCREAAAAKGWRATVTDSAQPALWFIHSHNIDVVLLGLKVSDGTRLQILREIKQHKNDLEVAILTTNSAAQSAVEAMKAGACDCLIKPFDLEELRRMLDQIAIRLKARIAARELSEQIKSSRLGGMIGRAPGMQRLYRIVSKAAQSTHPVLILGESGTGKELVAKAIHYSGPFRDQPFIPIDCGSLVTTLIESELFGYVKGAFTGASQSRQGLLGIAQKGTIFLDEIGELPLDLQAKLLRVLQEKEVRPVGSTKSIPINARILAATNRDLEQAVGNGTFRRDLYFRLNVLSVRLPPLRERREDIPLLAAHILERISRASARTYSFIDEAMQALTGYDWPGNVRELENCIERCCAMNSGPVIHSIDLPTHVPGAQQQCASTLTARIARLSDLEREAILTAIAQLNGDKLMAARLLGIGKTTLYRKLKAYQVLP
jgi:DNA-binding NtrC family response regulator